MTLWYMQAKIREQLMTLQQQMYLKKQKEM